MDVSDNKVNIHMWGIIKLRQKINKSQRFIIIIEGCNSTDSNINYIENNKWPNWHLGSSGLKSFQFEHNNYVKMLDQRFWIISRGSKLERQADKMREIVAM